MAFCTKCGAAIDNNAAVCPNCGAPQQAAQNNNAYVNPSPVSLEGGDFTATMDPTDIAQNKVMGVLAYIGLLFLVPLLAAPNSQFARFHANQGLILFISDAIVGTVITIFSVIFGFIPIVGPIIVGIISSVLGLFLLVLMILGIVNAATGKAKELPLIGKIRIIK